MPKISEHGGPSEGPWDAPGVEVSEEQYTDIMSRHGTPQWTPEDERLAEVYRANKAEKEDERTEQEQFEEAAGVLESSGLERADDDLPPYEDWAYKDLQTECKARGLNATGTQTELAERLQEDDERQG